MITTLAWTTTREARGLDEDEELALPALRAAGVAVDVVEWSDPTIDWSSYDRVIVRSTWDYAFRLDEFLAWVDAVNAVTQIVNPPEMARWNIDKRYLAEVAEAGIPTTHTMFVEPGESVTFPQGRFVVKPAIGAGSRDAAAYSADQRELAVAHIARLHDQGKVVLVQPFVASVATEGEWPMLFFNGEFSHSASKRVNLPQAELVEDFFAAEDNRFHDASPEQISVAQAAVEFVTSKFGTPTYARVDLVRDDDGGYRVLEIELIEPSLFLPFANDVAMGKFVAAVTS